jgi:hypothetical protein
MTQNRYYTNLGQAAYLSNSSGLNNVQTNVQTSSNVNWPTSFPFVLSIAAGTVTEELVEVTSGSGSAINPYIVTRGFDDTTAQPHNLNDLVVPKICQLDLAEPQQHINLTGSASGAHGLPASAWLGGTMTLVNQQVLASPASTVSFTSTMFSTIPSSCSNLTILAKCKTSYTSANIENLMIQLNGYTGANYGDGYSLATSNSGSSANHADVSQTQGVCGLCWTSNVGTSIASRTIIDIPGFTESVWAKGYNFQSSTADGATLANSYALQGGGVCSQVTGAVSSITLFPQFTGTGSQFVASSIFELYAY